MNTLVELSELLGFVAFMAGWGLATLTGLLLVKVGD